MCVYKISYLLQYNKLSPIDLHLRKSLFLRGGWKRAREHHNLINLNQNHYLCFLFCFSLAWFISSTLCYTTMVRSSTIMLYKYFFKKNIIIIRIYYSLLLFFWSFTMNFEKNYNSPFHTIRNWHCLMPYGTI